MTAQDYIETKLDELKQPLGLNKPNNHELVESIYKVIVSKKFRKYRLSDDQAEHIKRSIAINIENNEPINVTLVFGGYKLWRLEESPEAD